MHISLEDLLGLKGPLGPANLGHPLKVFPFGVLEVVLAGIGDVLSSDDDVAVMCREKDRGLVG